MGGEEYLALPVIEEWQQEKKGKVCRMIVKPDLLCALETSVMSRRQDEKKISGGHAVGWHK